ncbi:MAG: transporter [Solirubrobacteraceae bacterium]|nr:transporter [Solirubrobacteraceae bacterium]
MTNDDRRWWTLGAVCVATFMLLMDITIVNVALPDIAKDLGSSFTDLQWVIDAYALSLASLLLTAGSLADLFGRKRIFIIGLSLFTLSSLLCGLAKSPAFLTWARAAQGIGGAAMFATSLALLAQAFRGPERGTAFGIWGATIGAAVAVGPLVGGALTQHVSWQSIFLVNLPVGIVAIAVTVAKVGESKDPEHGGVDWAGLVTFSGGLFLLVFALVRGNAKGWTSALIVGCLIGSVVLLVMFVAVESRQSKPMLDLSLFRRPAFTGAAIAAFCMSAGMFAMFLYITLYLQNTLHLKPLETGLRFLPMTVVSFFAAPLSGRLQSRIAVRWLFGLGLGLVGVGLLLMSRLDAASGWTALLAGFIVSGAGIGITNPSLATTAVGVVQPQHSGMASGINNTFRQVGIATGIAGLGALFEHLIASKFHSPIPSQVLVNGSAHVVPAPLRHAYLTAYTSSLDELFLIAAIAAFVGAIAAVVLVRPSDFVGHGAPEPAAAA